MKYSHPKDEFYKEFEMAWAAALRPIRTYFILFIFYFLLTLAGSTLRVDSPEACYKSYPVDYILFTKLFCEIEEEQNDN